MSVGPVPPGERWCSLHLHADWAALPAVLAGVAPVASGAARWFFIFYGEGGPHLRVRLWLPDAACTGHLAALSAAAAAAGCEDVRNIPYEPEVARYGGAPCLLAAEAVFEASSRLAVHIHAGVDGRPGARLGWGGLLVAATFACLRGEAGVAPLASAYARHAAGVAASLGAPAPARPPVSTRVAARWLGLGAALARGRLPGVPDEAVDYLAALRTHFDRLREFPSAGDPPGQVLASHAHMTCNRLGLSVVDEHRICAALATTSEDLPGSRSLHAGP